MFQWKQLRLGGMVVVILAGVALIGCSTGAGTTPIGAPTDVPPTLSAATPTTAAAAEANPTSAPSTSESDASATNEPTASSSSGSDTVTLVVVPAKSTVNYRVREQLAGVNLPSDAVGSTNAITGQIVGKMDGTIVSDQSKFVVDVTTLRSDQSMRDGFIQRTPLHTSQYPTVTFVPKSATGLPTSVSANGQASFQLIGDLTVKDVTKSTTWQATCQTTSATEGTCTASTSFTFEDFGLEQPRVGRVLSIEDNIKLEINLAFQRQQ